MHHHTSPKDWFMENELINTDIPCGPKENCLKNLDLWTAAQVLAIAFQNLSTQVHFKCTCEFRNNETNRTEQHSETKYISRMLGEWNQVLAKLTELLKFWNLSGTSVQALAGSQKANVLCLGTTDSLAMDVAFREDVLSAEKNQMLQHFMQS